MISGTSINSYIDQNKDWDIVSLDTKQSAHLVNTVNFTVILNGTYALRNVDHLLQIQEEVQVVLAILGSKHLLIL